MKIIVNKALNSKILTIISIVGLVLILIFKVPSFIENRNLSALGYDENALNAIKKLKISNKIIQNKLYSPYLNKEVVKNDFKVDYLKLYTVRDNLTDRSFKIYDALSVKGYSEENILKLFKNLKDYDLVALLVFDLQNDAGIDAYIQDATSVTTNNEKSYRLNGTYIKYFENIKEKDFSVDILVNQNNSLKQDSVINLVDMSVQYATEGLKLQEEAYQHFRVMVDALSAAGMKLYAIEGYRDFKTQQEYYDQAKNPDELGISRAGQSDFNTGLAVQVVSSGSSFKSSSEYQWLINNAHNYGFIVRFPEGKEYITGKDAYYNILRYVGSDIATIMKQENLSLEEYHALYVDNIKKVNTK